jgi:hypothetical protein
MPGVISVFPNTKRSLHTTHSWDFMGLSVDAAAELPELSSKNQENVIIGFIDTGVFSVHLIFRLAWKFSCVLSILIIIRQNPFMMGILHQLF